jgi:hypothetical protein
MFRIDFAQLLDQKKYQFVFGRPNKNEKSNKNFLANEKCPVCRPSLIFSLIRVFKNNVPCLRQCTICDEDMLSNLK